MAENQYPPGTQSLVTTQIGGVLYRLSPIDPGATGAIGTPDPLAEIARLREIEQAARRYILLEGCPETDIDAMYAAWKKIKTVLGLSDLTSEQAAEELRKMDGNDAAWAEAKAMAAIPGKDPS